MVIRQALKEWAVTVAALEQGETILLLRKGGIREPGKTFTVTPDPVWLYPTYEHQKPHLLKPDYANQVSPVASGWHPERVRIGAWAQVTDQLQVTEADAIAALLPFHVWNEQFVRDRLRWQAKSPLHVLLLRVYRLPAAHMIAYRAEYGGCQSWIELQEAIMSQPAVPVLTDQDYAQQVSTIRQAIRWSQPAAMEDTFAG